MLPAVYFLRNITGNKYLVGIKEPVMVDIPSNQTNQTNKTIIFFLMYSLIQNYIKSPKSCDIFMKRRIFQMLQSKYTCSKVIL